MGRKYGGAMSKKRIRVKTTTKYQAKLNREIKKFNWEIKNREINKEIKHIPKMEVRNILIEREIKSWNSQFIDKMMSED